MTPVKSIAAAYAIAILLGGCMLESEKTPVPEPVIAEPELVHSKSGLILTPGETFSESLFVKNAAPGAWTISLLSAPTGTSILNGVIRYSIPAGLTGPLEVHAIASDGAGKILDLVWSVTALPNPNLPPVFTFGTIPEFIVAGRTVRILVKITDPEGDPLTFKNELPVGAVYHDSILEWTPSQEQVGVHRRILFNVFDNHGHNVAYDFSLKVLSFDPDPYRIDMRVGRVFWMRGFLKQWSGTLADSIHFKRSIAITRVDPATGAVGYTVTDTLSGTLDSIRTLDESDDPRLPSISMYFPALTIPLPFTLPDEEPVFETRAFVLQGKEYAALHQIAPNTCLNGGGSKYYCGGHEYTFVPGLGRVFLKEEGRSAFSNLNSKSAYEVWAISEP